MMNLRSPSTLASVIILTAASSTSLTLSPSANAQELTRIVNLGALLAPKSAQGAANGKSILAPITKPLGDSLAPLIDTVDMALDPLTDPIDDQLGLPVLDALSPLTDLSLIHI